MFLLLLLLLSDLFVVLVCVLIRLLLIIVFRYWLVFGKVMRFLKVFWFFLLSVSCVGNSFVFVVW